MPPVEKMLPLPVVPQAEAMSQSRRVAIWLGISLGWLVIAGLYVGGRWSGLAPHPPYPSGGASIALAASWFAFVLALNGVLTAVITRAIRLVDRPAISRLAQRWDIPIYAVAMGLGFARLFWSDSPR
jgi:hypothetical protein